MEMRARWLWKEDAEYCERRYLLRQRGKHTLRVIQSTPGDAE
jgi:hypothetical protein